MQDVSIGEAARRAGIKVPTIRYYEQIGLLPAPARTAAKRRLYTQEDLKRLSFIRHARELGFEVDAIRTLLSMQDHPAQSCVTADALARQNLVAVEKRIARLETLRDELKRMIEECSCGRVAECRVIETLANDSHAHGRLV